MLPGVLRWVAVRVFHNVTADDLGVALVPFPVEVGDEAPPSWSSRGGWGWLAPGSSCADPESEVTQDR
jgi:hypothetical protein